jgi:hypothetical protein
MDAVVQEMVARGLARSAREVSARWMGMAPNYCADRKGRVGPEAALRLYIRLRAEGHADLADGVWRDLAARAATPRAA